MKIWTTAILILMSLAGCADSEGDTNTLPDARTADASDAADSGDTSEAVEIDGDELEPWAAELVQEYDVEIVSSWPYSENETLPAEPPEAFDFEVERVRQTFVCTAACDEVATGVSDRCVTWMAPNCSTPCPLNLDRCSELSSPLSQLVASGYECEFEAAGWQAVDPAHDEAVLEFYDEIESQSCL